MKIVLDAMGGDFAPRCNVKGAVEAILDDSFKEDIILVGFENQLKEELASVPAYIRERIEIVNASEKIEMWESPTEAYRKKTNSSLAVCVDLIKSKKASAMVSAGNTGAYMATALFNLGRIKGVSRPAIAVTFPSRKGPVVLLDVGANAECKPENLLQFAVMGEVYARYVHEKKEIKIGLLNIGSEENKGNDLTKNAYKLLKEKNKYFVGNIEGRDIFRGDIDVILCDGFVGNIVLKCAEGMASLFAIKIKEKALSSIRTKLGALVFKPAIDEFKKEMDYSEYGGALLLGVEGICLKSHGSSDSKSIKNALKAAAKAVVNDINGYIKAGILELNNSN